MTFYLCISIDKKSGDVCCQKSSNLILFETKIGICLPHILINFDKWSFSKGKL